ncbi:cell envelope integrity EipB family protein [Inquilinus limosus]|uniref:EipB family protein n=1 Tax=Inquilinus limosus TaxID=171674 RepID=UPI003F155E8F
MSRIAPSAALALLLLSSGTAQAAPAVALQPHRAVYSLTLDMTRGQRSVIAIQGQMEYRWAAACDGSSFEQNYQVAMVYASGDTITRKTRYAGWESADGRELTYNLSSSTNGEAKEDIRGTARLDDVGAGDAVFKAPSDLKQALPPGSLFPTTHMQRLVEAMRQGQPIFTAGFFDGSSTDGPQYVSVAIGRAQPGDPAADALRRGPSHPINMAFFKVGEAEKGKGEGAELPEYELRQRLFENGIADRIVIDYGDFAMAATLDTLEPIAPPRCE